MYKAYKYRIYPNKWQRELIAKTFGCVRFTYNQCLAYKINKYQNENISLSRFDLNNWKNQYLKKEYEWLYEVDKWALDNAVINLDAAYKKFFKENAGYPKFKSKHNHRRSYKTNGNIKVLFGANKIQLPKLKKVKAKLSRKFDGVIKSAVISQEPSGKYYVSVLIETKHEPLECAGCCVGIDLGIKDLVITSDGEKFDNPKLTKKYEDKLAREQRKLSHKKKGSKNYEKQRIKVARVHEKIRHIRTDNLHKISHRLISESQVIISENLSVSNMVKNRKLSKSISDCGWYELTRQLEYKAEWNERQYIKIDRFFASSQMCSNCGFANPNVKDLSIREWVCPECATIHDRDVNAAINILNEGLKLLKAD